MRVLSMLICALSLACASGARAQLAELCNNASDDDGDELADCADPDCVEDPTCPLDQMPQIAPRRCECEGEDCEEECADPEPPPIAQADPRRYPQAHVLQPMTFLTGMLVPEISFAARNDPLIDATNSHFGLGITYGILDFWEVSLLALPLQVSPSAEYEHPSFSSTVRVFGHEIIEVGVYANVAIPLTQLAERRERTPTSHPLARSRAHDVAQLDLALLVRLHFADVARLDLALPVGLFVFEPDVRVDLVLPLRLAFQISQYGYVGAESGVFLPGENYRLVSSPLMFVLGATIPGDRFFTTGPRGPVIDARFRVGWPSFWDRAIGEVRPGDWQVTLEARVLTYLLP